MVGRAGVSVARLLSSDGSRMKWQIFIPIALLQIINLFWYFLIWRILLR